MALHFLHVCGISSHWCVSENDVHVTISTHKCVHVLQNKNTLPFLELSLHETGLNTGGCG